jgi:hypothetical protein
MYFNPEEAPSVYLQPLPSNAIGVQAYLGEGHYSARINRHVQGAVQIITWAPRTTDLTCAASQSEDEFYENHCTECDFNCDNMEIDLDGRGMYVEDSDGYELELHGYANAYSPCTVYHDGIGSVEFPCTKGFDLEADDEDADITLSASYLAYQITLEPGTGKYMNSLAFQQGLLFDERGAWLSQKERAINTFDSDRICWGSNREPESLLAIEQVFSQTRANEDLLTFESHNDNADSIKWEIESDDYAEELNGPRQDVLPLKYDGRPLGVVVATATHNVEAFVLMISSGCRLEQGLAVTSVSMYRDVALDDDLVLTLWVTDTLKSGARLAFYQHPDGPICVGQLPSDIDLTPCASTQQLSSAAGVPDNSCSPA